ncbi:MAG: hypothetical protein MZW92_74015 [Comamonadaceae bacterium]|nr:hypothetical protein [Comamonadaceae bacterium]
MQLIERNAERLARGRAAPAADDRRPARHRRARDGAGLPGRRAPARRRAVRDPVAAVRGDRGPVRREPWRPGRRDGGIHRRQLDGDAPAAVSRCALCGAGAPDARGRRPRSGLPAHGPGGSPPRLRAAGDRRDVHGRDGRWQLPQRPDARQRGRCRRRRPPSSRGGAADRSRRRAAERRRARSPR